MNIRIVCIFSVLLVCKGDDVEEVKNELEEVTEIDNSNEIVTTMFPFLAEDDEEAVTNSSELDETTTEELLWLKFDYPYIDRETFWRNNTFVCFNGTLEPSPYLKMKYGQCERIHRGYNPQCTPNCEMAITMLLESRIPNLEVFKQFFEITLPENLKEVAVAHYSNCFEKFGSADNLLDEACEKPQPFFDCIHEFQSQMVCSESEVSEE